MPRFIKGGRKKPWQAFVRINNTSLFLGYYFTKEEAAKVEDKFKAEKDNPKTVLAQCYCQTTWVWIPKSWIKKFTKSCGAENCVHPLMKKVGKIGNETNRPTHLKAV